MADEQYKWLNRDVAERLLRGEPLDAVDPDTRSRADRLAETLGALAAEAAPKSAPGAELPGEEAALAAFRTARTARTGQRDEAAAPAGGSRTHTSAPVADAGLVRLGRPAPNGRRARWGRPARFGLVASLAGGMFGGAVLAAGSGVLVGSIGDEEPERPVSVTSPAESPDQPLMSPSPREAPPEGDTGGGTRGEPTPRGDGSGGNTPGSGDSAGGTDDDTSGDRGRNQGGLTPEWWNSVLSACRDVRNGKDLDDDRRRSLEDASGGKGGGRQKKYCDGLLAGGGRNFGDGQGKGRGAGGASGSAGSSGTGSKDRSGLDPDEDDDSDRGRGNGHGNGNGNGKSHGRDGGKGKGHGRGNGNNHGGKGGGHGKGGKGGGHGSGQGGNQHRGQGGAAAMIVVDLRTSPADAPSHRV
ncbi:hypothetical protein ACFZCL_13315 [Streptomyces sp. NPDC008159]|uniref:hypothetical protein n=1 Tax=Streptomyces sp. NPDC008159 TaxID=3364817 RepID=UPI0036E6EEA6